MQANVSHYFDQRIAKTGRSPATGVLIGSQALRARVDDFERIFRIIAAPATGRWPGLLIWIETYAAYEPWGILIERDGAIVAAAVLTRRRHYGVWRIGKPGGHRDPVRFGALDDDAAGRLAQAIGSALRGFGGPWIMEIADLPDPDPVVSHLRSYLPQIKAEPQSPTPCLVFAPGAPLSNYLSRNTRAAVSKARNRIQREGIEAVQEWTRDPETIVNILPKILDTYRQRDHQLRSRSIIDDGLAEKFFLAFVSEHARQGLIDLLTIHLDGGLAAFALCLFDNEMHWVLVNRVSPDWLHYSPGTIANAEVVRHAFEDPASRGVNWGGDQQRYKLSGEITLIRNQTLFAWSSYAIRMLIKFRHYVARVALRGSPMT